MHRVKHEHTSLKDTLELYYLSFLWIALLVWIIFLGGCRPYEPSSTDKHNTYPQVYCHLESADGTMENVCCEGDKCSVAR